MYVTDLLFRFRSFTYGFNWYSANLALQHDYHSLRAILFASWLTKIIPYIIIQNESDSNPIKSHGKVFLIRPFGQRTYLQLPRRNQMIIWFVSRQISSIGICMATCMRMPQYRFHTPCPLPTWECAKHVLNSIKKSWCGWWFMLEKWYVTIFPQWYIANKTKQNWVRFVSNCWIRCK